MSLSDDYALCCADIRIVERPGGNIPRGQIVDKLCPYHERRNAEIALRDKGTPIPESLNGEAYRRIQARDWGRKAQLPWLFRYPERK